MKLTVFGTGYVGLVTGACLADVGHDVLCVDVDAAKIERLRQGDIPIYEPGLEVIVRRTLAAGRLHFTTQASAGVEHAEVLFIAVGTPPEEDGSADLRHVLDVAAHIAAYMTAPKIIVVKSTVPVGTSDRVAAVVRAGLEARGQMLEFHVVSNPEFLKEGAAVEDFMKPDRIIVGAAHDHPAQVLRAVYAPFNRNHDRLILMDVRSAELTKYAANALLATKISFMNEMACLAERVGADIEQVRIGLGSDPRIGWHFIYPGCGYGGSCFPKDVRALEYSARQVGLDALLLRAVEARNRLQKQRLFQKIHAAFHGQLRGKTIALWGLSFKPHTDDLREAPSRTLMEALWAAGAQVRAHDPVAMPQTRRLYSDQTALTLCATPEEALEGADALAIVTEWPIYRNPDFDHIRRTLHQPMIFDGRNLYDPAQLAAAGIQYFAIGRGLPLATEPAGPAR